MTKETREFNFILSDGFRDILSKFENKSIYAKLLLQGNINNDLLVDNPINYISISSNDDNKISYLTKEKIENIDPSLYWTTSKRYCAKPGVFLHKIFKDIKDYEVENFSNLYRAYSNQIDFTFKVVSGYDIAKYYHEDKYQDYGNGSLVCSCMKHQCCQDYLNIYCENPDKIKMLILFENTKTDKIIGRALLWNLGNYNIMDRIYTTNDNEYPIHFKNWASKNGYLHKSDQNWYNTLFFENEEQEKQEIKIEVELKNYNYSRYPYLDTFKFLNQNTGVLKNYIDDDDDNYVTLISSDGGFYNEKFLVFDIVNRILRVRGDCVYVSYANGYTTYNNVVYSDINRTQILCKDAIYISGLGYIFNEKFDHLNSKECKKYVEKPIQNNTSATITISLNSSTVNNTSVEYVPITQPDPVVTITTEI